MKSCVSEGLPNLCPGTSLSFGVISSLIFHSTYSIIFVDKSNTFDGYLLNLFASIVHVSVCSIHEYMY